MTPSPGIDHVSSLWISDCFLYLDTVISVSSHWHCWAKQSQRKHCGSGRVNTLLLRVHFPRGWEGDHRQTHSIIATPVGCQFGTSVSTQIPPRKDAQMSPPPTMLKLVFAHLTKPIKSPFSVVPKKKACGREDHQNTFQWDPPERHSRSIFSQSKMPIRGHICLLEAKLSILCDGNTLSHSLKLVIQVAFFSLPIWPFLSVKISTSIASSLYMASPVNRIWKEYPDNWAFEVGFATWFSYWLFKIISAIFFNHYIWFSVCTLESVSPESGKTRRVSAFFHHVTAGRREGEEGVRIGNPAEAWVEEDER